MNPKVTENLPEGVILSNLQSHADDRGLFTEVYRESWVEDKFKAIQWSVLNSNKGSLRGMRVHLKHYDYMTTIKGNILCGLHDLRAASQTFQQSVFVEMDGSNLQTLVIPPGVAHGFYFKEPSIQLFGVSEYWDKADELGCYFLDEDLKLDWPNKNAYTDDSNNDVLSYQDLLKLFAAEPVGNHQSLQVASIHFNKNTLLKCLRCCS